MDKLKFVWNMVKDHQWIAVVVALIVVFLLGYYKGHSGKPALPETRVIEDTVSKQKLVEALKVQEQLKQQLSVAQKTISEMKVKTVSVVHVVYKHDGTRIVDRTTTTDVDQKTDTSKTTNKTAENTVTTTDNKTSSNDTNSHTNIQTIPLPKDKFLLGISGTVGLTGLSRPGVDFRYRLLDMGKVSVWTGASVFTGPSTNLLLGTELRVGVGISF